MKLDTFRPYQLGAIEWMVVSQLHATSLLLKGAWRDEMTRSVWKMGLISPSNRQSEYKNEPVSISSQKIGSCVQKIGFTSPPQKITRVKGGTTYAGQSFRATPTARHSHCHRRPPVPVVASRSRRSR